MKFRLLLFIAVAVSAGAQPPDFPFPGGGFGGRGRGGFGGPGGGAQQTVKLLERFDKNKDGWLNSEERKAAIASLGDRQAGRGFGPRGRGGADAGPATPGPKLAQSDVKRYGSEPLYDTATLRTLFFEFEDADWEKELMAFHNTDVEVPARLTVDGKVYPDVGIHFRGMSSFMMVPEGRKHSLNVSLDFLHKEQRLGGYKSLDLLNSNDDPSMLRTVLYLQIMREYVPAPKANFVRVVINGENWGIYTNSEQFNGDFVKERFGSSKGARWKVPGSPGARGGLEYLGDDPASYKRLFEIKSKDDPEAWTALIHLCKFINQTPPAELEKALTPILDIDATLRWLAVEKALINNDGYWIRSSDYSIYLDPAGKFHFLPHDANETLTPAEGGRGGGGQGGVTLDPLAGSNDPSKPLISKLLAVPLLRERYLAYVRQVAETWLRWEKIGPIAQRYHDLIAADVRAETRKLASTEEFEKSLTQDTPASGGFGGGFGGRGGRGGGGMSLKPFVEQRRAYLLKQ